MSYGFWLFWLREKRLIFVGFDVVVRARSVMVPGGGVQVMAACNGVDMMSQIVCVSIIFLLAFPIRSALGRFILLATAPVIGMLSNSFRIAVLTVATTYGSGKGSPVFKFFHDDAGSLVFSGIAVFIFGWLYLNFLERELASLESAKQSSTEP